MPGLFLVLCLIQGYTNHLILGHQTELVQQREHETKQEVHSRATAHALIIPATSFGGNLEN